LLSAAPLASFFNSLLAYEENADPEYPYDWMIDEQEYRQPNDKGCGDDSEHNAVSHLLDITGERLESIRVHTYFDVSTFKLSHEAPQLLRKFYAQSRRINACPAQVLQPETR